MTKAIQEFQEAIKLSRASQAIEELRRAMEAQQEMLRSVAQPIDVLGPLREQLRMQEELRRFSTESEHRLLASIADCSDLMRGSAIIETLESARRLSALVPKQPDWVEAVSRIRDGMDTSIAQLTLSAESTDAVLGALETLDTGEGQEIDVAPGVVAELVEVVESTTPILHAELLEAQSDTERLEAFVRWWCNLPPVVQLALAILLQWMTCGLAGEYLKDREMLPGLRTGDDSSE